MSKTISGYHTSGITPTKFRFRQQPEPRIWKSASWSRCQQMTSERMKATRLPFLDDWIHIPGHKISIQKWVVLAGLRWHHYFWAMGCGCHGPCHWRPSSLILELQRCARSTGEPDTTGATNEWVSDVLTLRFLLLKPSSSWKELKFWLLRGHDYSSHKNCFIPSSHGLCCMQMDLLHNGFGRNLAGMTLHPFQLNLKQNNKSELIYPLVNKHRPWQIGVGRLVSII